MMVKSSVNDVRARIRIAPGRSTEDKDMYQDGTHITSVRTRHKSPMYTKKNRTPVNCAMKIISCAIVGSLFVLRLKFSTALSDGHLPRSLLHISPRCFQNVPFAYTF